MLAFFAVRGIPPERIINSKALTKRFYYHAMNGYYREKSEVLEIIIKLLGGEVCGKDDKRYS